MQMGLSIFVIFIVYAVVNTYLPLLLASLGYSPLMIGILQSIFEAAGTVCPLLFCSRIDRRGTYGKAMVFLAILFIAAVPVLLFGTHFAPAVIGLIMLATGMKGIVPVSDAYTSLLLKERADLYGTVRVLGSIGFVLAVLILQFGAFVNDRSYHSMLFWIGIAGTLLLAALFVHPSLLKKVPRTDNNTRITFFANMRAFPPVFFFGIFLIFLGWLGLTPSQKFISLYVRDQLHLQSYSFLWAVAAASEIPIMYFSGTIIKKTGALRAIALALIALCVRNGLYVLFPSFAGVFAGQLCHSISYGLLHPAAVVFIAEKAPPHLRVLGMTIYTALAMGLAGTIGNIIGGAIIEHLGYKTLFAAFITFPLIGVALYTSHKLLTHRQNNS